ncbi:8-amino-7-oxononanoate synthase [Pseudidiomarina aestuarii]|uniref:8-amino-7-oxononanoate synthase n=2 Tax=Pseudidiomarina aestuarii TaxID=624146 RepID=A0A2T4D5J5_9GAMM|nr:8-amino-7-oxononanoate synthase [Pseudidiomarina aestuarii]PTB89085.1 8-amino-7-oxononanoate synthase [Pseudidiomarina aestuarii]
MVAIRARLQQARQQREQLQRWRQLPQFVRADARFVETADGRRFVNFASNDYLGLSDHPLVKRSFADAVVTYGSGGRASPLVTGLSQPHTNLQRCLAEYLNREQVLLFSSGFAANHGVLQTLAPHYNAILADKLVHASWLSGVRLQRFQHNDVDAYEQRLSQVSAQQQQNTSVLVLSESVFSMDGDQAPVQELLNATIPKGVQRDLWLDDAHGFGTQGEHGLSIGGTFSAEQVPLLTLTFGKAVGVAGAAVATSQEVADYLTNYCRELVYSTQFPAAQAAAIHTAVDLIVGDEGQRLRQRLAETIQSFQHFSKQRGLPVATSSTAIQHVIIGADADALWVADQLREAGIWCTAMRPPTVPEHTARLRITLTAAHKPSDVTHLVDTLATAIDGLAARVELRS